MKNEELSFRKDHRLIADLVRPGGKILDLGCGNGELLELLRIEKGAQCTGIDRDPVMVSECVSKDLRVFNLDFNECLGDFSKGSYDHVILYDSLQESVSPEKVIENALRIGESGIIGFPNMGFYRYRARLLFRGLVPCAGSLLSEWYDTRNLRSLTVRDFEMYCRKMRINIQKRSFFPDNVLTELKPNLFAEYAIFILRKSGR